MSIYTDNIRERYPELEVGIFETEINVEISNLKQKINATIHSVTGERPIEVNGNPSGYPDMYFE